MDETNTVRRFSSDVPFETLISAIKSGKDQKKILKNLYAQLLYWSLSDESVKAADSDNFLLSSGCFRTLCITLFEELQKRLFVKTNGVSKGLSHCQATLEMNSDNSFQELNLLLRCCMVSLISLQYDQDLLSDKIQCLREMLHVMFTRSEFSRKLFDHEICDTSSADDFAATFSVPESFEHYPSYCRILEVFIDEFLASKDLGKCVAIAGFCHPRRENILFCDATDIGCVLEAILAHFLISVSGFLGFEQYFRSFLCMCKSNCHIPEVSLASAVTLLIDPAVTSAPSFLRAHVISLVSEVFAADFVSKSADLELTSLNCYFHSFEQSVSLYHSHMSKFYMHDPLLDASNMVVRQVTLRKGHSLSFSSHFGPRIGDRISSILEDMHCCLVSSHCCSNSSGINRNMVSDFTDYVKENLCIIEETCRDVALSFFSFIIAEVVSTEADGSCKNENLNPEEVSVLASILKLMGSSMLQVVRCLRRVTGGVCSETCEWCPLCKGRDFLVSISSSFRAYKICGPIQELLLDRWGAQLKYNGSKVMLMHMAGLLSFCMAHGLELVSKSCLFVMMVVMDFLFFQEGNSYFLSQLASLVPVSCSTKSSSSSLTNLAASSASSESDVGNQRDTIRESSVAMASYFKVIQNRKLRKSKFSNNGSKLEDLETGQSLKEQPDIRKGGMRTVEHFDWDILFKGLDDGDDNGDIEDFLDCKPNFSRWLKAHAKYRNQSSKRISQHVRERMKALGRRMKSRNS